MFVSTFFKSLKILSVSLILGAATSCSTSNLNMSSLIGAGSQALQAATISNQQIQAYVHQYIQQLDNQSKVAPANNPYSQRLARLTQGLTSVDGIPLNFKVYLTNDVNAFACADGSVRVYSGLMDRMTDDEVLGVIGHEIGHVAHKDTKKAFQQALLSSAVLNGIGATSATAATLTSSQLAQIGQQLLSAKYSRKQESNADDYGYDFLKSNGKNPWSMALAFSKLSSMESTAATTGGLKQMFSSHPSTPARISHIVARCKKDNIAPPAGITLKQ